MHCKCSQTCSWKHLSFFVKLHLDVVEVEGQSFAQYVVQYLIFCNTEITDLPQLSCSLIPAAAVTLSHNETLTDQISKEKGAAGRELE